MGGRNRNRGSILTEVLPVNLQLGKTANVLVNSITSRPSMRCFRPDSLVVEAVMPYMQGNANGAQYGAFCPGAFQILLMDPSGKEVAASPIVVLGMQPRRIVVRYPPSGDWFQHDHPANAVLGQVRAVCMGQPSNSGSVNAYVRGFAYFRVRWGPEIDIPTCPAPNVLGESEAGPSSSLSLSSLALDDGEIVSRAHWDDDRGG